jgi:hypothetical protein
VRVLIPLLQLIHAQVRGNVEASHPPSLHPDSV